VTKGSVHGDIDTRKTCLIYIDLQMLIFHVISVDCKFDGGVYNLKKSHA